MAAVEGEVSKVRKNEKFSSQVDATFTPEIMKTVVESIGFDKPGDDVLEYLAENVTLITKEVIQEATKFKTKSKHKTLSSSDIDLALKVKNIEPVYGFTSSSYVPFRHASGGGRELYFQEDAFIDLEVLMSQSLPKAPLELSVKSHWLAIDGIQPSIPENPPPVTKQTQLNDVVQPFSKSQHVKEVKIDQFPLESSKACGKKEVKTESKAKKRKIEEAKTYRTYNMGDELCKSLITHELSVEQQLYYKELTEASVGLIETKRIEALHSLSNDPGLYQLLPRFVAFISEGVRINVAVHNMTLLIYLLKMTKALLENSTLYLEKYLHELIPAVMTCIISKQLCPRPDFDNHWVFRDTAAKLMAQICRHFNTPTNNIQSRITKILYEALAVEDAPLSTHYGAITGLCELGHEVIKLLVLPKLKTESNLIVSALHEKNGSEKKAAEHLQALLIKHCAPVISQSCGFQTKEQFINEYGQIGNVIFQRVSQLRINALNRHTNNQK